jgi:hypothetical protein
MFLLSAVRRGEIKNIYDEEGHDRAETGISGTLPGVVPHYRVEFSR